MTHSPDGTGTWKGLWHGSPHVLHVPLDEETRRRMDLPRTLLPAPAGLGQPVVFDPALKQFANAYRAGEPRFKNEKEGRAWHRARRTVLDLVLAAIADGPWVDHLVLRGSVLMVTWFGDAARDPGDLDFVVVPPDWAVDESRTARLFTGIARDAAAAAAGSGVTIDAAGAVTEEIWTYDRVPGRRMLLPWTAPGVPGGSVQLDIVFNEILPAPAALTVIRPLGDGPGSRVLAASPGLSLAWKLLWLVSDAYPQGKDLYDAVLLAERTPPEYEPVRDAFVLGGTEGLRPAGPWWLDTLDAEGEWKHFATEHPWVQGTAKHYQERLARALAPLLDAAERPGEDAHSRWARWLRPLVDATRAAHPADPATVLGHLAGGGRDGLIAAVVILREIAGPHTLGPHDALAAVLAHHDNWSAWRANPGWWPMVLDELGPGPSGDGRGAVVDGLDQ